MLWFRRITCGNADSASQSKDERDKERVKEQEEKGEKKRASQRAKNKKNIMRGFPCQSFYAYQLSVGWFFLLPDKRIPLAVQDF